MLVIGYKNSPKEVLLVSQRKLAKTKRKMKRLVAHITKAKVKHKGTKKILLTC